ncbi:hypothetical protein PaecuDRAFT_3808 [Paenibacillus curdlanolyticus YK9]|uniref:Uncharacterized protein n=1 Tax=Paenibacillus curdlanolyticus YK9 TaxID=717606 RepID=E0IDR7_9BACL|nr:hypothetical protein PaecuDRAFT_3808 [Paenibacillus curdlanolyticus YK9]
MNISPKLIIGLAIGTVIVVIALMGLVLSQLS